MTILQKASYSHQDVQIESRQTLFRGFLQVEKVSLRHRLFQRPDFGTTIVRELIHRPEAAGVLLHDPEQQKFALIEQFRVGAMDDKDSAWQLEIIAGVLDGNESPEDCLYREAFEESGCQIQHLQHLFSFYPSAGACSELFHLYIGQCQLPQQGGVFGLASEGEDIQLHLFDYSDLSTLLPSARLRNAPVIMALQWLQQHTIATHHDV